MERCAGETGSARSAGMTAGYELRSECGMSMFLSGNTDGGPQDGTGPFPQLKSDICQTTPLHRAGTVNPEFPVPA